MARYINDPTLSDLNAFYAPETVKVLPWPAQPNVLVASDLDETYLAHCQTEDTRTALSATEIFLLEAARSQGLVFGWVTGSVIGNVLEKVRRYHFHMMPAFIASSLGTEMYLWCEQTRQYKADVHWRAGRGFDRFSNEGVDAILARVHQSFGVNVAAGYKQQQSPWKISYYLDRNVPALDDMVAFIFEEAERAGIAVAMTPCNPQAGDPDNHLDIDFVPQGCGKKQAVEYMQNRLGVAHDNTFAFGDSGNDLAMLSYVKHGFLVANAMAGLEGHTASQSEYPYAEAILREVESRLG